MGQPASPRFSIIVPLYNKGDSVDTCLQSVFRQTFSDFEALVIDDGSTDHGLAVATQYTDDPRMRLISRENRGKSYTRNEGILIANSELIALIDADDEWHPDFLETIDALINDHPEAGIFGTGIEIDKGWGRHRLEVSGIPAPPWSGIVPNYYCTQNLLSSSSIVIRKNLFPQAGLFNPTMATCEDMDQWMRLAAFARVAYSSKICVTWHYSGNNHSSKTLVPDVAEQLWQSADFLMANETVSPVDKKAIRSYCNNLTLRLVPPLLSRGARQAAHQVLRESRRRAGLTWPYLGHRVMILCPTQIMSLARAAKRLITRLAVTIRP